MKKERILVMTFLASILAVCLILPAAAQQTAQSSPVFSLQMDAHRVQWMPAVSNAGVVLTVVQPDGGAWRQEFGPGVPAVLETVDSNGVLRPDGQYSFELRVNPVIDPKVRRLLASVRDSERRSVTLQHLIEAGQLPKGSLTLSGTVTIKNGALVPPTLTEPTPPAKPKRSTVSTGAPASSGVVPLDVVHADDVIITGSLGVGFDCLTDGTEPFGFDTVKLKENNLRLFFEDTSATAGFPANDWRIIANDSSSGGADYLAIEDSTGAKTPFKIAAGARTNSLYVSSTGRIGLGTATPVLSVHTVWGDTPSFRLEQDGSSGWTAQTWDMCGNESSFFIRDVTGGSRLSFRIQSGTPTNTVTLKADGNVGLGTWSPDAALHVQRTGGTSQIHIQRTDGDGVTTETMLHLQGGSPVQILATLDGSTTWTQTFGHNHYILAADVAEILRLDTEGNMKVNGWTSAYGAEDLALSKGTTETLRLDTHGNMAVNGWTTAFGAYNMRLFQGAVEAFRVDSAGKMRIKSWESVFQPTYVAVSYGATEAFRLLVDGGMKLKNWTCAFGSGDAVFSTSVGEAMRLDPNGNLTIAGTLTESSDVNAKENFAPVKGREVLDRLAAVPIQTWNFKKDKPEVRHIGPMAQDFHAAFGLNRDPRRIAPLDVNGVALAAIQELDKSLKEKDSEIEALRQRNAALEKRLTALERSLNRQDAGK